MDSPEFRELTTVDELTAYLRLREARWPLPGGLEVNPYDRWSRFLGLFDAEGLQAALRLVVPRSDSPQLPQLRAAVERVRPEALGVLDQAPGWRLTLEEEFGAQGLTRRLDALEAAGVPYCEAGRFVAHPHRPRADTIFRLVPKAARWSVAAGRRQVFAAVRTGDLRAWRHFGFAPLAGLGEATESYLRIPVLPCLADWGPVAERARGA